MDETTKAIIAKITVRTGSGVSYDCAALSPNDLARMAAEATGDLAEGTFDLVLGIAYRGIFFAAAVAGGHQVAILQHDGAISGPSVRGRKVLIVDDIFTGAERLSAALETIATLGGSTVGCACIVDRTESAVAFGGRPVWSAFQARDTE
jgi:orotate phosphoribosyltransferase